MRKAVVTTFFSTGNRWFPGETNFYLIDTHLSCPAVSQISNLTAVSSMHTVCVKNAAPMVLSWNSWNCPFTKRNTNDDLPTADSPSNTNLNWQIFPCADPFGRCAVVFPRGADAILLIFFVFCYFKLLYFAVGLLWTVALFCLFKFILSWIYKIIWKQILKRNGQLIKMFIDSEIVFNRTKNLSVYTIAVKEGKKVEQIGSSLFVYSIALLMIYISLIECHNPRPVCVSSIEQSHFVLLHCYNNKCNNT